MIGSARRLGMCRSYACVADTRRMQEAKLEKTEVGLRPASDGWFVVNIADAAGRREPSGAWTAFESEAHRFPQFGINVQVLADGEPNCLYHRESNQEAMLVLEGTPLLI